MPRKQSSQCIKNRSDHSNLCTYINLYVWLATEATTEPVTTEATTGPVTTEATTDATTEPVTPPSPSCADLTTATPITNIECEECVETNGIGAIITHEDGRACLITSANTCGTGGVCIGKVCI